MISVVLEQINLNNPNMNIIILNENKYREYFNKYDIESCPTVIFFKNGEIIARHNDYMSYDDFLNYCNMHL